MRKKTETLLEDVKGWLLPQRISAYRFWWVIPQKYYVRLINFTTWDITGGDSVGEEEREKDAFSSNSCETGQLVLYFLQMDTYFLLHIPSSHVIKT